ncbi:GAF domain-containing protein [Haloechinothrix halophila YIM 93223]|uniref:GAF domain-containing protein n=1 Tax=Haloechinothrix halophila YIM 93223 TaxID=592678 RepID=W9DM92_9PSEU|nr:GAF domain-containing protein [Haloechinothrix halophila YIM 93223]
MVASPSYSGSITAALAPGGCDGVPASVWASWRALIDLTDTLDTDLGTHLQRLCRVAVQLIDVFEAAVVVADSSGAPTVVAASSERTRALAEREIELAEGPAVTCCQQGETLRCPDLDVAERWWPRFAPIVHEAGMSAIHVVPMWHRARTHGALTLYSVWPGTLVPADDDLACALTDAATIGMLQLRRACQHAAGDEHSTAAEEHAVRSRRDDDLSGCIDAIIDQYNKAHQKWTQFPRVYEEQLNQLRRARETASDPLGDRTGSNRSE